MGHSLLSGDFEKVLQGLTARQDKGLLGEGALLKGSGELL